jgi:hypothetical protein
MVLMVNIIKQELPIEESLRKKIELICEFAKTTIINGSIRKIKSSRSFLFRKYKNIAKKIKN